jgi:hypothetical protein
VANVDAILRGNHEVPTVVAMPHSTLVQELVELHAGRVSVDSICGAGSTFRVSVPLGRAHLPPGRIHAQRALSSTTVGALADVEEALRWLPSKADEGVPKEGLENQILC